MADIKYRALDGRDLVLVDMGDGTYAERVVSDIPSALLAGQSEPNDIRRLATDNQPASYEANKQFKIFHRFIGIPATTQIAFSFSTTVPLNILERNINLWAGGREYLVIPDDGSYTTQDAAISTDVDVRVVNGNLEDSGLAEHPESDVTVKVGLLTGGNQFTIGETDQFPNGDVLLTGDSGFFSVINSQLSNSVNKSGVAAGQKFFLVFRDVSGSAATFQYYLQWEER